jgi:hypothetical protein
MPHPRQGAVQFQRQDDAQQCGQRLDGRGFSPRLLRDYNQLVESYNRGANI